MGEGGAEFALLVLLWFALCALRARGSITGPSAGVSWPTALFHADRKADFRGRAEGLCRTGMVVFCRTRRLAVFYVVLDRGRLEVRRGD